MSDTSPVADAPLGSGAHGRHLARSTAFFAAATALSRVLGLVREMVAAYYFGITGLVNAFTVAFQIPNLVRALVADAALSGAFVPVFSELLEKGEKRRAWRVASTIFWLVLLVLGGLTALFILIAPLLLRPFGNPGGDVDLAVGLARVLFPIVVLLGLTGVVVGILNSYDQFSIPALTPVLWNVAIIAGLVIGVPRVDGEEAKLYIYAGSIVFGTLLQLLLPLPWLRGLDGRLQLVLDWRDPAVRRFFALLLPVTLSLGLINVNALIDSIFASRLIDPEQAPAAIDKAFRLYMLPQGMFSVAVATVLFPTLARLAARRDLVGFRATVGSGLRQIGFLLIPAAAISAVLAEPIVRLVYQRGAFTEDDVGVVAACLAAFSLGLVFNGWMLMLTRGFYGLQSNWLPTTIAVGTLLLNAGLNAVLYTAGTWAIPLATSLTNIAGAAVMLAFLHRRAGPLGTARVAASVLRVTAAAAVAAAVAFGVWYVLDRALGRSLGGQLVSLGIALVAATATYLGSCHALAVRELGALLALRRGREDA
ncbi:MAG TPA: murein biosynthesis integral membrane protein MurJ [Gaiellaceae bacterium]|nr:murein biosynthesis integral membrane protein MurJ [Gaiellaceae bacterium]